jgi:hypothetical protein
MFKKYEVEQMIKDRFLDVDGCLADELNEDGSYDLYFVNVENNGDGIIADFITCRGSNPENEEHDKYKITVEFLG